MELILEQPVKAILPMLSPLSIIISIEVNFKYLSWKGQILPWNLGRKWWRMRQKWVPGSNNCVWRWFPPSIWLSFSSTWWLFYSTRYYQYLGRTIAWSIKLSDKVETGIGQKIRQSTFDSRIFFFGHWTHAILYLFNIMFYSI